MTLRNHITFLLLAALLTAVSGCAMAGSDGPTSGDGGADLDGGLPDDMSPSFEGAPAHANEGERDSSGFADAGAGPGAGEGPVPPPAEGDADPKTCFDGIDNDGGDGIDCDASSCFPLGACCVGSGDCCSGVTGAIPARVDLEACVGGADPACIPFGAPQPWVETTEAGTALLAPGGDDAFDSGLLLEPAEDLGLHRIAIRTTFRPGDGCGVSCAQSAGIALTTQPPESFGAMTHVEPRVGLLLGGDGRLRMIVAGEPVASWTVESEERWELVVRPTGIATARHVDGAEGTTHQFALAPEARLALYGRTPAEGEGPRLSAVTVSTELCDIPTAWTSREPVTIEDRTGAETTMVPRAPSIARIAENDLLLAFEREDAVWLARGTDGTTFALTSDEPAVQLGEPVSDPELLVRDGVTWLYYTRGGGAGIGRSSSTEPEGAFRVAPVAGLDAETYADIESLAEPTVAVSPVADAPWLLVARAEHTDGAESFVSFFSTDRGASWARIADTTSDLSIRTDSASQTGVAAGADELAQPSLHVFDRAWHLYYARRRGTRWSVGLMASEEMRWWRPVEPTALGASGQGFDRLGASAPDALRAADLQGGMDLYYVGHDGVQPRLGRAHRTASQRGQY